MSKFADFLKEKKIDARRVLAASHQIESLQPEDRALKLQKRQAKNTAAAGGDDKKAAPVGKPRTGRPITQPALEAALAGKAISGPQKTRFVRAINRILEQKKQGAVDLKALF